MISPILDLGFHFPVLCSCLMAKRFKKVLHWASYTYHTVSGGIFDFVSLHTVAAPTSHMTFGGFLPGYQDSGLDEFQGKLLYFYPGLSSVWIGLPCPEQGLDSTFMEDLAKALGLARADLPPWWQISEFLYDSFTQPAFHRDGDFEWLSSRGFSDGFLSYLLKVSRKFMDDPTVYDLAVDNSLHYFDLAIGLVPGPHGWGEPLSTFYPRVILHGSQLRFPQFETPLANRLYARRVLCGRCCNCCCDCSSSS